MSGALVTGVQMCALPICFDTALFKPRVVMAFQCRDVCHGDTNNYRQWKHKPLQEEPCIHGKDTQVPRMFFRHVASRTTLYQARKSVVLGKSVSVRVALGGSRII